MINEYILEKLLCYGFFPKELEEILTSYKYGKWIIEKKPNFKNSNKYFSCSYRLTRNNNTPRFLGIPHPLGYYKLAERISEAWTDITQRIECYPGYKKTSMISYKGDNSSKRLYSMASYDFQNNNEDIIMEKQFGKKYCVRADISSFYSSIYTHSICWAFVGKDEAKKEKMNKSKYYNKIDMAMRNNQDGETKGLPISPDVSGIIAELILAQIDQKLTSYSYVRYIDDYKCYCKTIEECNDFLLELSNYLDEYKLLLNSSKTLIEELPKVLTRDWVHKLRNGFELKVEGEINKNDKKSILRFLDVASELFEKYPNESPLKFALKILSANKYRDYKIYKIVVKYILNMTFLFPYLIDICDKMIEIGLKFFPEAKIDILGLFQEKLGQILQEHIKYHKSDVTTWCYYLGIKYELPFSNFIENSSSIIDSQDCVSMLLCYLYGKVNKLDIAPFLVLLDTFSEDEGCWIFFYEVCRIEQIDFQDKRVDVKMTIDRMIGDKISFLSETILERLTQAL